MKTWMFRMLSILMLCSMACCAFAEEAPAETADAAAVGRLEIPEWTDEMWPAPHPVDNEDAAVAWAK